MRQLPTGTVTFLFTDIEGSTKLWEQQPEVMGMALARHEELLRQAIGENGGFVFKTVGDAFCVAFSTASQALQAALVAQQAMEREAWSEAVRLRVRMALHTGSADERDGDYFGQALNRVARLLLIGHGGQTLLSLATQELTRDALPAETSLLDLGQHRLKDLGRPETIFQLLHPSLSADFPPLRSLDNPALPNNLPPQVTSFIGRVKEVAEIKGRLLKTRLLTLTGVGGSGKSRLSLQVAADVLDQYEDGAWLVEFAPLTDSALVPQVVAQTLGVKEQTGRPIQQVLVDALKSKHLLLMLDNCEHLVSACASLAADLLKGCSQVHLLASSREPLNVAGEQTYRVPSLTLPDPKQAQTAEALSQYEAVRLFIERTLAVQPSFTVTDANVPAVAQVCWRLDGIPLAIELAAARVRSLPVEEINARLDNRFRLLTGGARDTLPRHQTLRAAVDWSYDLLTKQEKTLLCRLSVFASGWTLSAAESVCSGKDATDGVIEDWDILDLLTSLVDNSLVVYEERGAGEGRSRLQETVRQYARDRLVESGEAEAVGGRHAAWSLALAEATEPQLTGHEQLSWLERLETEHDNLRAALVWYQQLTEHGREPQTEGAEGGPRLAGALWRFWLVRGYFSEGRQWLGRALGWAEGAGGLEIEAVRAKALNGAGNLANAQSDFAAAQSLHEECLTLRRHLGDLRGIASSLNNLGNVALQQGNLALARALHEESLTIKRRLGYPWDIANSLNTLGQVVEGQGDSGGARALMEEGLAINRRLGNQGSIAESLHCLGQVVERQGDYAMARVLFEESMTLRRQLGNHGGIADSLSSLGNMALHQGDLALAQVLHAESLMLRRPLSHQSNIAFSLSNLGTVALRQGDFALARTLHAESLAIHQHLGNPGRIAYSIVSIAGAVRGQNQGSRAAQLLGAAVSLCESYGGSLSPADQEEVTIVHEALGDEAFTVAWDVGRAMTLEQAVEYALEEV